jgi:hypothetical protein
MDRNRLLTSDVVRLGILTGLCLALGVYLIATTVLISKDGVFYISQAQDFARDPLGVAQRHPPGYPVLLWIAHATISPFIRNDSVSTWIHVSQSVTLLCRMLALIPLYLLGKSLIGGARAFWAVLILVVLPYPAQYGSDVLTDWPYVMVLSLGLWLLYWALRRRAWWLLALVGLDAAMGYLIQPASAQLVLYGLVGLAVVLRRDAKPCMSTGGLLWLKPSCAAVLLIAGFAVPMLPYACATGAFVPRQLRPFAFNSAPVITSVGGRGASRDPLEFEVREGELLEITVEAFDSQGDSLAFSLAAVPVGSRPVCQFWLTPSRAFFATISEEEKNTLLDMFSPTIREYEGIVYYAYAQSDVRANLEPVHRFWSPTQQRHFYTIQSSEKDIIQAQSPKDMWTYEGIAFYAFAEGRQPPDAVPVHRYWSEQAGYSWAMAADSNSADDGVAWYVHVAGEPPAGMTMEDGTLRWRPGPGQRGEYGINIIVSDGKMESCQLVKVMVHEGPTGAIHTGHAYASAAMAPLQKVALMAVQHADLRRLPGAVDGLFDGFAECLMVFFVVPWGVGFYYRMRYEADRLERVLITAVIAVNAGLILGRYMWVAPTMERRYCLPLIALTIFYVPVGLEHIARRLGRRVGSGHGQGELAVKHSSLWFHILAMVGIAICLPKLLTPLYAEKDSYLKAVQWLRDNTQPEEVTAVPDSRLTFYAQRPGLIYRNEVDPRRADYIVRILDKDAQTAPPAGWSEEYSVPVHDRHGRTLVIYKTHRRKGS